MRAGSARRTSDVSAGDNAMPPIRSELEQLFLGSLSWLQLIPMVRSFMRQARSTLTLTPRGFYCTSFSMPWTKISRTGGRHQSASWTMQATTGTPWPRSTLRSRKCRWYSRQNTAIVPHLASSFFLTSRKVLSMSQRPKQENCKYNYFS